MEIIELFQLSIKHKASDLHISPDAPPILRINGELTRIKNIPVLNANTTKSLVYSIMKKEQQQEFEKKHELDFSVLIPNIAGFRANAFYQIQGIAAVFRVIPEQPPTLSQLKMPTIIHKLLNLDSGLILVTGETGCGKSTTLAAMIDEINVNQAHHIITLEDPIEFIHKNKKSLINQRQIHRDTRSFATALRAALREDPDVILVGEMRDAETIRLALTAAETGHLVMTTLHTHSAPSAVNRIIDAFPTNEKNMIRNVVSQSLRAVIYQTLVPTQSGDRVAAIEIMVATAAIKNLIREDKTTQLYTFMQTGKEAGMNTLDQHLQELLNKQVIDTLTAHNVAVNKELFRA